MNTKCECCGTDIKDKLEVQAGFCLECALRPEVTEYLVETMYPTPSLDLSEGVVPSFFNFIAKK